MARGWAIFFYRDPRYRVCNSERVGESMKMSEFRGGEADLLSESQNLEMHVTTTSKDFQERAFERRKKYQRSA